MPANTLDIELKKYYSLLSKSQKESVVKMLKSFINANNAETSSIEEYNNDIDRAIAEYKRGEVLPHEAVVKMAKKW